MKAHWFILGCVALYLYSKSNVEGSGSVDAPDGEDGFDLYGNTLGALQAVATDANVSSNGLQFTAGHEGLRLQAYWDAGSYSIGYGHKPASKGQTCTQEQADAWLQEDLTAAANTVLSVVTADLSQDQFDALADLAYNVGSSKFRAASQLLAAVNDGGDVPAQLARWNHSGGVVDPALTQRCADRIDLWNAGAAA